MWCIRGEIMIRCTVNWTYGDTEQNDLSFVPKTLLYFFSDVQVDSAIVRNTECWIWRRRKNEENREDIVLGTKDSINFVHLFSGFIFNWCVWARERHRRNPDWVVRAQYSCHHYDCHTGHSLEKGNCGRNMLFGGGVFIHRIGYIQCYKFGIAMPALL